MTLPTRLTTSDIRTFEMSLEELIIRENKPKEVVERELLTFLSEVPDILTPEITLTYLTAIYPQARYQIIIHYIALVKEEQARQFEAEAVLLRNTAHTTKGERSKVLTLLTGVDTEGMDDPKNYLTMAGAARRLGLTKSELTSVLDGAKILDMQAMRNRKFRTLDTTYAINSGIAQIKVNAVRVQRDHAERIERMLWVRNNKDID